MDQSEKYLPEKVIKSTEWRRNFVSSIETLGMYVLLSADLKTHLIVNRLINFVQDTE